MYLFFDTETTGLPRNSHASIKELENWPRVVQLAWLTYSNTGKLLSENDYIIKPEGFIIPNEATKIHGITTKKALVEGNDLSMVLAQFARDVKKANLVVAHNIDFDEKMTALQADFAGLLKEEAKSKQDLLKVFKELGYEIKL